ncbi:MULTISPECIES: class F sortase [Microbacterium]|uniref:Sortase family protein n=1 Tax=Microbacterium oxydans TaxID=82380 RepID=A0A3S9WFT6_9MICO|nr:MULTISPECIES: class F sortase [Microbacterium]AZS38905.1 hypothetical protein CVS54_00202 [Microbacterium oxydans]
MTALTKRRTRVIVVAAVAVAAVAVVAVGWLVLSPQAAPAAAAVDMRGNSVVLDPDVTPVPEAEAVADIGARFEAPSVSLDVPLGELSEVEGQITPPGFTSAYLVRNRGVMPAEAAEGTVYVVMHSLRNGGVGPGNALFDIADGSSRVAVGDTISVSGVDYRVESQEVIGKKELPTREDVWSSTPDRLVVITCLQSPDGKPSTSNFVLIAQRTQQ